MLGTAQEEIEGLIAERAQARQEKNWHRADEIRDKLAEMSVILEDKAEGTRWRIKTPSE
jgi:cysteinyl-tRNA synthetase